MKKLLQTLFFTLAVLCFIEPLKVVAASTSASHLTLIINQIRGRECCDVGNLEYLERQFFETQRLGLSANWAVRYDALLDEDFKKIMLENKGEQINFGAMLEITPSLAGDAGVIYRGDENNWFWAGNSYLVGYEPDDRAKIIETYMKAFQNVFGELPNFSTAWLIDPLSLKILHDQYGVQVHQITREQFGTDSYALYGGPPHYPYYPSENWALIPDNSQIGKMPLIVRQTITDPVYNYGDFSSSYTSQPNDYALQLAGFDYFEFIFGQAHRQLNDYTFALIGLENSMHGDAQDEYFKQLELVADWDESETNKVTKVVELDQAMRKIAREKRNEVSVYAGLDQIYGVERAWWITTEKYRVRIRLTEGELFISDLRLYDANWRDPYYDRITEDFGWWIVPYLLDSSRSCAAVFGGEPVENDSRREREEDRIDCLERIVLLNDPQELKIFRDEQQRVVFQDVAGEFLVFGGDEIILKRDFSSSVGLQMNDLVVNDLETGEVWWRMVSENNTSWKSEVSLLDLDVAREKIPVELFPERKVEVQIDEQTDGFLVRMLNKIVGFFVGLGIWLKE